MSYVLKTNQLSKVFKGKEVLSDVNMKIKKGEIYGLLTNLTEQVKPH